MRHYRTAVVAVLTVLSLAFAGAVACSAAPSKFAAQKPCGDNLSDPRPELAIPEGMKLNVIVKLRIENDPIGNYLADRLQEINGYCPGEDGDRELPWQLYQEILAHLAAPSRLDDDYPQARWEREQFVIELKAIPLCRAGA